jgi:hypothetical protein
MPGSVENERALAWTPPGPSLCGLSGWSSGGDDEGRDEGGDGMARINPIEPTMMQTISSVIWPLVRT